MRRPVTAWDDLLEPFLDTWHDDEVTAAIDGRLAQRGFGADEIAAVRERVEPLMRAYNLVLWEWVSLDYGDVLEALTVPWVPDHVKAALGDLDEFRTWAAHIADREATEATEAPEAPEATELNAPPRLRRSRPGSRVWLGDRVSRRFPAGFGVGEPVASISLSASCIPLGLATLRG
ncbi:hypothetical protein [Yinghuangia sp. YIM S09857]|uniref:hypothetical protein n=1 Tax=Yinghuangia sp. YIM S09857 TaxID=3436929 RepID=UPI003F536338